MVKPQQDKLPSETPGTLPNSNHTEKLIFLGFLSPIYCNSYFTLNTWTLDNWKLPPTWKNLWFPLGHFLYNTTLDNLSIHDKQKKL